MSGEILSDLVPIARAIVLPMALYAMSWTWTGYRDLMRGRIWPVAMYRAAIASFAILTFGFNLTYFMGSEAVGDGPWSALWLTFAIAGHLFVIWGRLTGHFDFAERFYWLLESGHLKSALAMADYHAACPEEAERLADCLREKTAKAELKGKCDG